MGLAFRQPPGRRPLRYGSDMPLIHSASKKARQKNVKTLMHEVGESPHVQSRKQAIAIAYSEQRRAAAKHHKSHRSLDHSKVSKWTKGERRDYR
jgi:hypothetical protein